MSFPEINRAERGYPFYPSSDELATIPDLSETEDVPLDDRTVHARYFIRGGEWFVMEVERNDATRMLAFGWAEMTDGELGYTDLIALESLRIEQGSGRALLVERDLDWMPRPWQEVRAQREQGRRTIVLTDRAVATEDGLLDPASIARFVDENAEGLIIRVYVVIDMMNKRLHPLAQFARDNGFVVGSVSTTRREETWSHEIERAIAFAPEAGTVVVCDPGSRPTTRASC